MQITGTVVFWRDDKGFGFVVCDQTQQKLFFHIRDAAAGNRRPVPGDQLRFVIGSDKRGRDIASNWQFINKVSEPVIPNAGTTPNSSSATDIKSGSNHTSPKKAIAELHYAQDVALYFRCGFLILVIIGLLFGSLPYVLPILYLEASLLTYWLYKVDKLAAIARTGTRLPEESLQLFSFIGGWPGALLAQKKLAHKRSKFLFQREFWFVVVGNTVLLLWLLSKHGQEFLGRLALLANWFN